MPERDRWMDEAERVDCDGGTDGAQKGDGSEGGSARSRKEGERVEIERESEERGGGVEKDR